MATAASQTIATALNKMGLIAAKLRINDPEGMGIERVYERPLAGKEKLVDTPAVLLTWTMPEYRFGSAMGIEGYTVNMRIAEGGANTDLDHSSAVLNAFHEQVLTLFSDYMNLDNSVEGFSLRMGPEGQGTAEYGGEMFVVLDYFFDLILINERSPQTLAL